MSIDFIINPQFNHEKKIFDPYTYIADFIYE